MEFVVEKASFVAMAERVLKCVAKNDAIPILAQFKVTAADGRIEIAGTNCDLAACGSVPADVKKDGSVCIPAALVTKSVKAGPSTEIAVSADGKQASFGMGRTKFKVPVLPANDFPDAGMLTGEGSHKFTLPDGTVSRVAKEVAFAVSHDADRFYLHGVHWRRNGRGLDFVATDGKFLSLVSGDAPDGSNGMPNIIVPTPVLSIAPDGMVVVSEHFVRFEADGFIVASKLIDGSFPDYPRLIPSNDKHCIVDRTEFEAALSRVAPFGEGGKENAICLTAHDGELFIDGASGDSEASDVIRADGDAFQIGMASRVISAIVSGFSGETIRLSVSDAQSPMIVSDPLDDSHKAVAMPYRIRAMRDVASVAEAA